jgi:hypothetical protein
MSHKHKKHHHSCEKPRYFHDTVGEGTLDSTPIIVPTSSSVETGTIDHPGPFVAQAFHPSGQRYFGLLPRRNTPDKSPEKAGKVIMDDKKHGDMRFYKPRIKDIHKKSSKKKH